MTADQIRAEAIRRVSVELAQADPCRCEPWVFADQAARMVDALGDLLPTDTEDGQNLIRGFDGDVIQRGPWERRYVGDWFEVTE